MANERNEVDTDLLNIGGEVVKQLRERENELKGLLTEALPFAGPYLRKRITKALE